jgi:hypothetical protein
MDIGYGSSAPPPDRAAGRFASSDTRKQDSQP